MKKLIIYLSLLASSSAFGQTSNINLKFEVDGHEEEYNNCKMSIIRNADTISVIADKNKLALPSGLLKSRATVIFYINRYVLKFDSIPITINNLSPQWTVGIDNKPFDKKKHPVVKSWKKVKILYYLHNDDGRTFTVDNYKKKNILSR